MWSAIKKMFSGEDAESKHARERMAVDLRDPRKAFVWGVVAVSYKLDPGYLTAHATEAIRDWYGVKDAASLMSFSPQSFGTRSHPGYNHYRLAFLARAGFGAGMIDEATSWAWAIREAAAVQRAYPSWEAYGEGYLAGHLEYRASQGDPPARLAEIRASVQATLAEKARTVWVGIPYATPLA